MVDETHPPKDVHILVPQTCVLHYKEERTFQNYSNEGH